MPPKTGHAPEFSRSLAVEKIPSSGMIEKLEADEQERRRVAGRFGLVEVKKLQAQLDIQHARAGQAVAVTGRLVADIVQKCVVTLEPLATHVEHDIDVLYEATAESETGGELAHMEPDESETEPLVNGIIDLGELVTQNLGVAIDPYPRKPGVVFAETSASTAISSGPFAKLAEWRKKKE
ncbi:MAG: DUF177 domain-containing protein [Alphaproteobacteria bacterium]|nr:DUF177 domain-containing protein [Alphaproteobacteria bacterium]